MSVNSNNMLVTLPWGIIGTVVKISLNIDINKNMLFFSFLMIQRLCNVKVQYVKRNLLQI